MRPSIPVASGNAILGLPSWGRAFWQDPNDGGLVLVYASGNNELDYVTSTNSGLTWSTPRYICPIEDFNTHNNFDTAMDRNGNVHCVHRYNSSGCYTLLAKDFAANDWVPSGVIARGFVSAGDVGIAKGVNASIEVTDTFVGPFSANDVAGPFPVVRLLAKDSSNIVNGWWVPNPFSVFPKLDDMSSVTNLYPAGQEGGYPVFTRTGNFGRNAVYSVDATGILRTDNALGTWRFIGIPVSDPSSDFSAFTVFGSGYVSRIAPGPNMARLEAYPYVGPPADIRELNYTYFLMSDSGNINNNFSMMMAANETQLVEGREDSGASISDVFVNVESSAQYINDLGNRRSRAPLGLPFKSKLPNWNLGHSRSSGTLVDLSYGNEGNRINLYFLNTQPNGEQVISRLYADITRDWVGGTIMGNTVPAQNNTIVLSEINHPTSGVRSWAPATIQYAGGGSGFELTWENFKALRHPTPSFEGVSKKEIVVTAGSGIDGKYRLVAWDYQNSVDANYPKLATFVAARTGLVHALSGLTPSEAQTLIDGDTNTGSSVNQADQIVFDFTQPMRIDRMEIAWVGTSLQWFHEGQVDGSLDDVNYKNLFSLDDPRSAVGTTQDLIKYSAEYDPYSPDTTVFRRIKPFVSRYVKITFAPGKSGGVNRTVREIRFYGAHQTAGKWVTSGFSRVLEPLVRTASSTVETFSATSEGSLPSEFITYGDFSWGAKTSTGSGIISEISAFQGQQYGNGDAYALRTPRTGIISGQSGVLECTINVDTDEVAFDGSQGRTIQFDMRYHLVGSEPSLTFEDEGDDKIYFETVTSTGVQKVYYPGRFATTPSGYCPTNICDYFTYRTTVPTGISRLKWVYIRGTTPEPGILSDEGAVWIDNVVGIKSAYPNSINGYLLAGVGDPFSSPTGIYGFMSKKFAEDVYGYINSDTAVKSIVVNAFTHGRAAITGGINAYTVGYVSDSVNAYTKGAFDQALSSVNAFIVTSGAFASVFGHMQNKLNESINGYLLAPSGAMSSINSYIITPEFSSINGYVSGPEKGITQINAYLDSKGDQSSIHGYIFASGLPSGNINGYLLNEGDFSNIFGHISKGTSSEIAGFVHGSLAQTGIINAWISGVGLALSNINAYLPSVSGVASDSINCYTKAAALENGTVYATMIGFRDDDSGCNFPLSAIPSVIIPTGNFFI